MQLTAHLSKLYPLLAFVLATFCDAGFAQDFDALGSRFARTTITQNDKPLLVGAIFTDTANNLIAQGAPLANLIARAYAVEPYRVVEAPAWVYQEHLYDIEAVPPPANLIAANETLMLQSLLRDRFRLQTRRETRELRMLVLDVADPEKQRQLALASPRIDVNNPPTVIESGTPMRVGTRMLLRGRDEPILDLTGGSVYVRYQLPALPYSYIPLAALVERLQQAGVALEYRTVPLDVVVVTAIEHPVLDPEGR